VNLLAHGNVLDTFRRSLMAAQLRLIAKEEAAAEVVIHPRFTVSNWHDFENFGHYLQAGREAATAALPAIRELLQRTTITPLARHETRLEHLAS
jgi:NTE family protein